MAQNDLIFYPTDDMRSAAAKIQTKADLALQSHNTAWTKVQNYVQSFPGFMQGPIMDVLSHYEKRLRASYQWQKDFASTLSEIADEIDSADSDIANSFDQTSDHHYNGFSPN